MVIKTAKGGIKNKHRAKGLINQETTKFHQKGLSKDNPDYKSDPVPQNLVTETKDVFESVGGDLGLDNSFISNFINGPSEFGANIGRILTGQADPSSISQNVLFSSLANTLVTGYIINAVSGRQPMDSFGYSIGFGSQATYGLLMRA